MCNYRRKLTRILRKGLHSPVAADPQCNSYVQQLACEEDRPFSRYLLNRAGRDCAAADERKPESALRASIGRTLMRADRRRRLPSSRSARGSDREGLTCKILFPKSNSNCFHSGSLATFSVS